MAPCSPQKDEKSKKILVGVQGSCVKIWPLKDRKKKCGSSRKRKPAPCPKRKPVCKKSKGTLLYLHE